jgi:hypothetical protein
MSKLQDFRAEFNPIKQNRMLFEWFADDQLRAEFLRGAARRRFPVLKFKSLLRSGNDVNWPNQTSTSFEEGGCRPGGSSAAAPNPMRARQGARDSCSAWMPESPYAAALPGGKGALSSRRDGSSFCAQGGLRSSVDPTVQVSEFDLATGLAAEGGTALHGAAVRFP